MGSAEVKRGAFMPRSVECLKEYNLKTFLSDLVAGVTVGLVALPLALAFAISSGVPPQEGLYCAIIAGFLISALGGSKVQIGGPTGAFVVVVSSIVAQYGIDGLHTCTLMAGAMLLFMGVTGLGSAVKYIPRAVVIGFTNGIAVLIASTQVKDFLGVKADNVPGDFIGRMDAVWHNIGTASGLSIGVAGTALALILFMRKFTPKVPGSIVALFGGTFACWAFGLPLETIGSRFGEIPSGLPELKVPALRPDLMLTLLSPALTITMLGAIESLLSCVVADRLSGDRHNPNVELFAQGVANIMSPLTGGLPATGAIARTATNIKSGAKTPVAGMLHALTLLLVLLVAAPLAKLIPLCILAAILLVVAWNMGEWSEIPDIVRLPASIVAVWATTFLLTVFADLTVAVEAGMIMAVLLFIQRVTATTKVEEVTRDYISQGWDHILQGKEIPDDVAIFRIHGPFLFGATDKINVILDRLHELPRVVVLRLRNMNAIDATGLHAIENLAEQVQQSGRTLILCGMREQPADLLKRIKFHEHVGHENMVPHFRSALERAKVVLN